MESPDKLELSWFRRQLKRCSIGGGVKLIGPSEIDHQGRVGGEVVVWDVRIGV